MLNDSVSLIGLQALSWHITKRASAVSTLVPAVAASNGISKRALSCVLSARSPRENLVFDSVRPSGATSDTLIGASPLTCQPFRAAMTSDALDLAPTATLGSVFVSSYVTPWAAATDGRPTAKDSSSSTTSSAERKAINKPPTKRLGGNATAR